MSQKPIFPIRLGEDDKKSLEAIKNKYGLVSLSDAVRLSIRSTANLNVVPATVKTMMKLYETENPDTLVIQFSGEPEPVPQ